MAGVEKRKRLIEKFFIQAISKFSLKEQNRQYLAFRVILLVTAVVLISGNWYFIDRRQNYTLGSPSDKTYFALTSARYEDKAATLELRQKAASRIIDVMVQDEKIAAEVSRRLDAVKSGNYASLFNAPLLDLFGGLSQGSRRRIIGAVEDIGARVRDEAADRDSQTSLIWKYLKSSALTQSERNVAFQMLDVVLNPSLQSDSEMASRLREDVSSQIPAVIREVRPGSVLVQKGQLVTPSIARLLQSQGYPDARFPYKHLIFVLLIIAAWSFWPVWIENGLRDKLSYNEWVYIAAVLSVSWALELVFARLGGGYSMAVLAITGWLCLTLPVSLSYHVIVGGGVISVMIAFGTDPGIIALGCVVASFAAGIGRVFFLESPNNRVSIWKDLFVLGLCLGTVSVCLHWGLGIFFDYKLPISCVLYSAIWATIILALLPLWENLFDVLSQLRLLELSHPSQPLIKRLQIEAPGTYHHTIMVGTLAEAAADQLHMNGLLVRAGAYYHDIGKLKNPRFFVENQLQGENIHDKISPVLSGRILISHVRDGLEIADEQRLPKALRRFIAEHHGTTVQKYFYEKAKALGEEVTEEQFRYPGPRPRSRETALVMLADSVEAAVKARNKPFSDMRELQTLVHKVIYSKIDANQLKDVDFTMREMSVIENCFVEILRSSYHSREVKDIAELIGEKK